jgi:Domain of unknown function (DUF1918)
MLLGSDRRNLGGLKMAHGNVGDRVVVESERTGRSAREGLIVEVLGTGEVIHYRIKWDDGHETTFFPSAGSISIIPKAAKAVAP